MFAKLAPAFTLVTFALATLALAPFTLDQAGAASFTGSLNSGTLPDLATVAMLLAGCGMVGYAARNKRTTA